MALLGLGMDSLHGSISATPRASVEERNSVGRTALSFAAALNNIDAVEHLLRKGADPNSEDNQNQTPLYYTISYGDSKSAQLLLDAGAVPQNDSNQLFSLLAEAVRRLFENSVLDSLYDPKIDMNAHVPPKIGPCGVLLAINTLTRKRLELLKS